MSSTPALEPGGATGRRSSPPDDDELTGVLDRLSADAPLFGEGASTYEAGVVDAVEAVRALLQELRDGSAAN